MGEHRRQGWTTLNPSQSAEAPQTHSCWSADSSFPPKPPPPTGGCRAQYDRPQSAYLPAQGTGHPTLVGFSSEGDSPRTPGGLLLKSRTEIYLQRYLRVRKGFQSPLSQIVRRGTGWGSTPSIFLAGSAALPWRPLAHDVLPRSYPRLGVGVIRFPHTWDGPRLGVSAHERAATIPAIFFHTECNPPRLGPKPRPAPLPTWCTPLTRGLT